MAEQATCPESTSPDKVVEGLEARRDKLQNYIIKFRFRWLFLGVACLIGTAANVAIDIVSDTTPSLADWYQGGLAGAGLYLLIRILIHAGVRANLLEINRTLAGGDTNLQTAAIPPPPRRRRRPGPEPNWKDQPLAVAAMAVAATIMLMVTAVIPIWDKEKDNKIAEMKTEPTKLKNELDDLRGQLGRMESENLKLRRDLDRLNPDSLFSLDDVYPKGFRSVRIGDRTELLSKVYGSEANIVEDESPAWIAVKFKNAHLFSQITYYYYEQGTRKTVTMILFHFDNKDGRTFDMLKQQLIGKYSQSKDEGSKRLATQDRTEMVGHQ